MRPPPFDTAQLSLVRTPFDDPDFLFELKHDGFRALAHIWDVNCELISRKRNAYKSFNPLRENLAKLTILMARHTEDIFPKRLFLPQIFYILRSNINSRRLICFVLFYLCAVLSVVAVDLLRMILPFRTSYWL
jgi:hypothetical protein